MARSAITIPSAEGGLSRYLDEIRRFPMLEPQEEYMLAKRWREHEDPEAAQKLVTSHLRLVAKIAMGYRGYGLPIGEVISEGNVGLMQAVKRFDPDRGFRLATYAMWWIRAAIQEYILRSWSLVKMGTTANQKRLFFNLRKAKSQIQALDRTQPGLPLKKGRGGTMTHDYKRHGTTTLFAALNVLDGSVIGRDMQRHRHQEFIRFLNAIEAELPKDKAVHVILDNYASHKQPKVRAWLARHPRWTFHFVPTSCSWLNAVEGFFAKLTRRRLKHGVFHSVVDLQAAINRFIKEHNQEPRPFIWKADPDEIIAAVKRGHQMLESIH